MGTTIQVDNAVKNKLASLKISPRESYNKVIERLIKISTDEGELSDETIRSIEKSLEDIKAGRIRTMKQVKERAGIR
jgi:hypothetical protein